MAEGVIMTTMQHPPIFPRTRVMTTQPNEKLRGEWTEGAWAARRWGVKGTVLTHHDSHGLCYEVWHEDDGTKASYDPSELIEFNEPPLTEDELLELMVKAPSGEYGNMILL